MHNLIGYILQLTDTKYFTQNTRYLPFCDMVCFVPTWSLFASQSHYLLSIVIEIERLIYSNQAVNVLGPVKILMGVTNSIGLYS